MLAGVTLQFAKLLPHTLLDGLFAEFDRSKHFSQSTLNADRILQISDHHRVEEKLTALKRCRPACQRNSRSQHHKLALAKHSQTVVVMTTQCHSTSFVLFGKVGRFLEYRRIDESNCIGVRFSYLAQVARVMSCTSVLLDDDEWGEVRTDPKVIHEIILLIRIAALKV